MQQLGDLGAAQRPVARQRDVNVARLVRDLLDAVGGKPGLVGAILDDGGDLGG
jgi:hypothetical protein